MTIIKYNNGNASISIEEDGTRTIKYEDDNLNLDYPLNIDIRVSTQCSFADNICKNFCHESAVRDGKNCDYDKLKNKLSSLPPGIELAIGCNELINDLCKFIIWCYYEGFIVNLTINQGHIKRDYELLEYLIFYNYIKGLGVSYRDSLKWNIHKRIINYPNTIFHVIAGIDSFNDVLSLSEKGVNKLLILGEKDFGYNSNKVDLTSRKHQEWFWWINKLFDKFKVVSFDNLALQQLHIKRFFTDENWKMFYQGEYSFYIDAVNEVFKPSSRSNEETNWNELSIKKYFNKLKS